MKESLSNKNKYYKYERNNDVFFANGNCQTNVINLSISENEEKKSFIIDTINVNTLNCSDYKVKIDYSINIFKEIGVTVSNVTFQVFKICDNINYKIPVNANLFYSNNNLNEGIDLLKLTVYDDVICGTEKCTYILEAIF